MEKKRSSLEQIAPEHIRPVGMLRSGGCVFPASALTRRRFLDTSRDATLQAGHAYRYFPGTACPLATAPRSGPRAADQHGSVFFGASCSFIFSAARHHPDRTHRPRSVYRPQIRRPLRGVSDSAPGLVPVDSRSGTTGIGTRPRHRAIGSVLGGSSPLRRGPADLHAGLRLFLLPACPPGHDGSGLCRGSAHLRHHGLAELPGPVAAGALHPGRGAVRYAAGPRAAPPRSGPRPTRTARAGRLSGDACC